jgi:adenylate cyclase class IV
MKYEEKRALVANEILEALKYSIAGSNIVYISSCKELTKLSVPDIEILLQQFEEQKLLHIENYAEKGSRAVYVGNIIDAYKKEKNEYRLAVYDTLKLQEYSQMYSKLKDFETIPKANESRIYYSDKREVLLDNKQVLSNPNFNSENDIVFTFLYKNPNITFTKAEIEINCKITMLKSFSKIIENLGFTKKLKSNFFDVSKTSIRFKNPSTL